MKKVIITIMLAGVLLTSVAPMKANAATNSTVMVEINVEDGTCLKNEYLEAEGKNTYTFTVPETGLYAINTNGGVVDTYGTLTVVDFDGTTTKYENDDHGDNVNFYFLVHLNKGAKCTLDVTGNGAGMYGDYKLLINKYE